MAKYRKRPVIIDAEIFDGTDDSVFRIKKLTSANSVFRGDECLMIHTLEGEMKGSIGDYIIRGVKGELYPCKPNIFKETYEEL
ncbi:MAG: hypothetical protein PF569_00215 [Candidatus Woesearchaeota archaeon]|jgi:hypothetical protein|nr:hypothetical protein [Candidatus Woesearchaeota archaeon]